MTHQQKQSLHSKKPSNLSCEPLRQINHLSPYHERVIMEKKYLEEKQHLRSILIMGHLQKMELNAINNRSIETIRKMKAAQEMSKKRFGSQDSTQDRHSLKKLKIDNRKKVKDRTKSQTLDTIQQRKIQKIQQVYQKLIDDYVKQVSKEKLLQKGYQRTKILQQACQTIRAQMRVNFPGIEDKNESVLRPQKILNQKRKTISHSSNHVNFPSIYHHDSLSPKNSNRSSKKRKASILIPNENIILGEVKMKNYYNIMPKQKNASCYRSITQVECNDNLKQIELEQNYLSKQRMRNQRLFLRKMKLIGAKSIRNLQRSSQLE